MRGFNELIDGVKVAAVNGIDGVRDIASRQENKGANQEARVRAGLYQSYRKQNIEDLDGLVSDQNLRVIRHEAEDDDQTPAEDEHDARTAEFEEEAIRRSYGLKIVENAKAGKLVTEKQRAFLTLDAINNNANSAAATLFLNYHGFRSWDDLFTQANVTEEDVAGYMAHHGEEDMTEGYFGNIKAQEMGERSFLQKHGKKVVTGVMLAGTAAITGVATLPLIAGVVGGMAGQRLAKRLTHDAYVRGTKDFERKPSLMNRMGAGVSKTFQSLLPGAKTYNPGSLAMYLPKGGHDAGGHDGHHDERHEEHHEEPMSKGMEMVVRLINDFLAVRGSVAAELEKRQNAAVGDAEVGTPRLGDDPRDLEEPLSEEEMRRMVYAKEMFTPAEGEDLSVMMIKAFQAKAQENLQSSMFKDYYDMEKNSRNWQAFAGLVGQTVGFGVGLQVEAGLQAHKAYGDIIKGIVVSDGTPFTGLNGLTEAMIATGATNEGKVIMAEVALERLHFMMTGKTNDKVSAATKQMIGKFSLRTAKNKAIGGNASPAVEVEPPTDEQVRKAQAEKGRAELIGRYPNQATIKSVLDWEARGVHKTVIIDAQTCQDFETLVTKLSQEANQITQYVICIPNGEKGFTDFYNATRLNRNQAVYEEFPAASNALKVRLMEATQNRYLPNNGSNLVILPMGFVPERGMPTPAELEESLQTVWGAEGVATDGDKLRLTRA